MCKLKEFGRFIKDGFTTFGKASRGQYQNESESISEFKAELFKEKTKADDKRNLKQDQKNIGSDVRKSLDKLVLR